MKISAFRQSDLDRTKDSWFRVIHFEINVDRQFSIITITAALIGRCRGLRIYYGAYRP